MIHCGIQCVLNKMRCVLGALVLMASALVASGFLEPTVGYHDAVGIPLAQRIKEAELAVLAENAVDAVDGEEIESRIVGGVVANANAHNYLAGLLISFWNVAGVSACGSSLLSANRLVTAAHCWFDGNRQASQFEVVLGSHFLFSGGSRIVTSQVVMHPQWNPSTLANDVAMIYLPTSVFFNQNIQPIALPSGDQLWDSFAGQWSIAAGYGRTSDLQPGINTGAQVSHVAVQVITVQACQAVFGHWALASNICTNGQGGVGICHGDSGGPLIVNQGGQNILVGISSFVAADGCELGHPSAFARVTSFHSFITQHMW